MKRFKIVIGILILQFACFFSANSQDLLNDLLANKDVTWMAETEIYFSLEGKPERKPVLKHDLSGIQVEAKTVKISPEIYGKDSRPDFLLQSLIKESVVEGNQDAFDTKGRKLTTEEFESYFTNIDIRKWINEETRKMLVDSTFYEDWTTRGFVVKMLWYYNQKELSIHSAVLSFEPVTDKYVKDDKKITISAEGGNTNLHYNDDRVMWCKATKINQFDFSKSKLLKGDHIQFLEEIFKTNIEKEKYKTYTGYYRSSLFYHDELEMKDYEDRLFEEIDTFVSFDPATYEEMIEVAINPAIDFKELNLVSFIHYWYWDEKSNALSAELKYIGLVGNYSERFRIKAKRD